MRALSVPVVLSSVVLTGWLGGARAQDLGPVTRGGSASTASQPAGDQNLEPDVIPQPSIDSPGLVTGFTLGELYTDNLRLAASGKPKQSSWITQVEPFIRAARNGPSRSSGPPATAPGLPESSIIRSPVICMRDNPAAASWRKTSMPRAC